MTGWTDEARQASIDSRAGGTKPGDETHHAAIKTAQLTRQHFVAAAEQLRNSGASHEAIMHAAAHFASTNKNFDSNRFVTAATKGLTKGLDIRSTSNKGYAAAGRKMTSTLGRLKSGYEYTHLLKG
jgi:hypothetical protein